MITIVLRIDSNLNRSNDEITYIPLQFPKFFVFYLASILNELPEGPMIIVQIIIVVLRNEHSVASK